MISGCCCMEGSDDAEYDVGQEVAYLSNALAGALLQPCQPHCSVGRPGGGYQHGIMQRCCCRSAPSNSKTLQ